jgi:hypothetical protein
MRKFRFRAIAQIKISTVETAIPFARQSFPARAASSWSVVPTGSSGKARKYLRSPATYAVLGDKERAFYRLEDAYKHHDRAWLTTDMSLESLNSGHMFDSVRSDPGFADLLRRIGLPR